MSSHSLYSPKNNNYKRQCLTKQSISGRHLSKQFLNLMFFSMPASVRKIIKENYKKILCSSWWKRRNIQSTITFRMLNINSQNMRIKFRVLIWSHDIEIMSRLVAWHLSACFSLKYNTLAKHRRSWFFKWDFLFRASTIWDFSCRSLLSLCQIILLYSIKSSYRLEI